VERSKRLIQQATGCSSEEAAEAFEESGRRPKRAIVMILLGIGLDEVMKLEAINNGPIVEMIRTYRKEEKGQE